MNSWEQVLSTLLEARCLALKRYAFLLCGNEAEAEDLVQDALVRAFTRPGRARSVEQAEAYVREVILNHFLDQRRRRSRWRLLLPFLSQPQSMADPSDSFAERDQLRVALGRLSPRQRACVVMRFYDDLPVADIADRLGCSQGNVKRHLSDALGRLAELVTVSSEEVGT